MIKRNAIFSLVFILALAPAVSAHENHIKYVGDMPYAGFCKAVLNDDVSAFKRVVRRFVGFLGTNSQSVMSRVLDEKGVKCDGKSLMIFSETRNATELQAYLKQVTDVQ